RAPFRRHRAGARRNRADPDRHKHQPQPLTARRRSRHGAPPTGRTKGTAMAKATITRVLMRDLPPPPEGTAKYQIFDDKVPGFIAERRHTGSTFYLRYTDLRGRGREV